MGARHNRIPSNRLKEVEFPHRLILCHFRILLLLLQRQSLLIWWLYHNLLRVPLRRRPRPSLDNLLLLFTHFHTRTHRHNGDVAADSIPILSTLRGTLGLLD